MEVVNSTVELNLRPSSLVKFRSTVDSQSHAAPWPRKSTDPFPSVSNSRNRRSKSFCGKGMAIEGFFLSPGGQVDTPSPPTLPLGGIQKKIQK